MRDERITRLAEILVDYSVGVKPGDKVQIRGETPARPLVEEVFRLVVRRGGIPMVQLSFPTLQRIYFEEASPELLSTIPPAQEFMANEADALISIRAPENTRELQHVEPAKLQQWARTLRPAQERIMSGGVRWVVCNYPTLALAQEAEMSLDAYASFLFGATNIDWQSLVTDMERVKACFDAADEVRVVGEGTDLTFRLADRKGIVADGKHNMPDGEVFYAPLEKTTSGTVYFEFPAVRSGRQVSGIRLEFEEGRVVRASADAGLDFLEESLNIDEGARYLGEFGIGCNYQIERFTKDTLFDEKIGGTIHLALGRAYTECGGTNQSALHWDLVKDLRNGGRLYADGRLVQENGRFLI